MRFFVFIAECEIENRELKKVNDFKFFEVKPCFSISTLEGVKCNSYLSLIVAGEQASFYVKDCVSFRHSWDYDYQIFSMSEKTCYVVRVVRYFDTDKVEEMTQASAEINARYINSNLR